MNIRKIAAAAGFACGAALAVAPISSADTYSDWLSSVDTLLAAVPAADTTPALNLAISFDGYNLLSDGTAKATTDAGQFGLAIAYGDHATAYAAGGYGDSALASGTYALAEAGSKTAGATGFNFDSATDIGNNVNPSTYVGAPNGAYAGGGSLIGNTDASGASSNDTAQLIGNTGINTAPGEQGGGNSGAFAGDSGLIGYNHVAGNGDTAYTSGNILGANDGSAAVGGQGDSAYTTGTETGTNEGAFSGFGNYNSATADTNYTLDNHGVSATFGNYNYASVYGPANSTADAGGNADHLGNGNIAYVSDPFGTTADSAHAGSNATASGNSDLAEVLFTHGNASAQGANNLYDIITPFGTSAGPAAATAAAEPAAGASGLASTVSAEISSLNSAFVAEANLYGVGSDLISPTASQPFETISLAGAPDAGTPNAFDYFLYGLNPIANASSGPGAYDLFNGALVRLDDAYNIGLYALENNGAMLPAADFATDLFGNQASLATELAGTTASGAITDLLGNAYNDLLGYFGI